MLPQPEIDLREPLAVEIC